MTKVVEYSSNNSGGDWWLKDEDWFALEAAGWKVEWTKNDPDWCDSDGRWLGALATRAERHGLSEGAAINEFERVTGQYADAAGCSCCGQPHYFYCYEEK